MISSTLGFAMHILLSSYQVLGPVARLVEYVLPYRNMAKAVAGNINFNSKHLKKGDPLPPYNGKLRLYNMRHCPFAQRVVLVLNAKKIDYEIINIDLMDKPEWLFKKSELGKVPSLEIKENLCIFESLVIAEYLDEVYPQRQLLPKDPVKKAFDKMIVEISGSIHSLFIKVLKFPDSISEDTIKNYNKALDYIQDQLKSRGTTFLDGNEPGYADYMIWPWFERIVPLTSVDVRSKIDPVKYKLLLEYIKKMYTDPVVSEYLVPEEKILTFFKTIQSGKPNYELLNE